MKKIKYSQVDVLSDGTVNLLITDEELVILLNLTIMFNLPYVNFNRPVDGSHVGTVFGKALFGLLNNECYVHRTVLDFYNETLC